MKYRLEHIEERPPAFDAWAELDVSVPDDTAAGWDSVASHR